MSIHLPIQHDVKELSESVSRVHQLKTSSNDVKGMLTQAGGNHGPFLVSSNDNALSMMHLMMHNKSMKQEKVGIKGRKRSIEQTNEHVQLKRQKIVKIGKPGMPSKRKPTMSKTTKKSKQVSI